MSRRRTQRSCDNCGKVYHRRNLIEGWDVRNPGHREGWHKTTLRICMECQSPKVTYHIINVAQVVSVPTKKRRAA